MAKTFSSIKKSLSLLDIIQFGKYKGCRVDSIVDMDDDYLRYMHKTGMKFDAEVIAALSIKFSQESDEIGYDPREHQEIFESYKPISFNDVPF